MGEEAAEHMTYTNALQQVYLTLGRIDGKLDSFDARVRSLEEKEAGRSARESIEMESLVDLKSTVGELHQTVGQLKVDSIVKDILRKYWWAIALFVLPVGLNLANTVANWGN